MMATNITEIRELSRLTKEEWREFTKTVWQLANVSHANHPAVFPVEIPKRLIKMFTLHGETVLDPFAGVGTTARAAIPLGRSAVCVEQNSDYFGLMQTDLGTMQPDLAEGPSLQIVRGDSRKLDFLPTGSVQLVVTSPPYWNKVDYGDGEANLGNLEQYRKFIESVRPVFSECMRVLAPGRKICVVTANVNQYTNLGLLTFPLPADFIVLLRDIGFVMVGEIIWSKDGTGGKWGSFGEQRPIFGSYPYPPNFLFKNVHEHILVFAKPPNEEIRKPEALPYDWLMAEAE